MEIKSLKKFEIKFIVNPDSTYKDKSKEIFIPEIIKIFDELNIHVEVIFSCPNAAGRTKLDWIASIFYAPIDNKNWFFDLNEKLLNKNLKKSIGDFEVSLFSVKILS